MTLETFIEPLIGARQIFGITGIIILIIFAQGLLHSLKHVFFIIFDIKDRKSPMMEMIYNFFAFGIIGGVFIFFTMAISFISIFHFDDYEVPFTDIVIEFQWMSDWLTGLVPVIFTFVLFYSIFRFISERRMNVKICLVAATSYIVLFEISRYLLVLYMEYAFTAYQLFYQGYAALMVIAIWAFYTALLFVFTTVLARAYQDIYLKDQIIRDNPYTALS